MVLAKRQIGADSEIVVKLCHRQRTIGAEIEVGIASKLCPWLQTGSGDVVESIVARRATLLNSQVVKVRVAGKSCRLRQETTTKGEKRREMRPSSTLCSSGTTVWRGHQEKGNASLRCVGRSAFQMRSLT